MDTNVILTREHARIGRPIIKFPCQVESTTSSAVTDGDRRPTGESRGWEPSVAYSVHVSGSETDLFGSPGSRDYLVRVQRLVYECVFTSDKPALRSC